MATKLKVGVLGAGRMGALHVEKYQAIKDAELVGVYEPDHQRGTQIQERYGVRNFLDLRELLFEVDAVTVAAPTSLHYSLTRLALEDGVHVLVEKPMCETVAEAEELIRLAERNRLTLQAGFIERFRLRSLIQDFDLGKVSFVETHRFSTSIGRESDIDVVSDLMIHDLDLVLSLINEDPNLVSTIGAPVINLQNDLANVRLEFPSGAVANLNASRVASVAQRTLRAFSSNSYLSLDLMANTVTVHRKSRTNEIIRETKELGQVDALFLQCSHFVESALTGSTPIVTGEDGLVALKVAMEAKTKIFDRLQNQHRRNSSDALSLEGS